MVVLEQSGCIRTKFVVYGQSGCIPAEVVFLRQKLLYSGNKWLYSGKSGCIREKVLVMG